jgi:hypothetical protein
MDPDPTKAWVKMTIPDHQGLIDISQVLLKYSKDSEIRKMAEKSIDEQSKEINQKAPGLAGEARRMSTNVNRSAKCIPLMNAVPHA